MSCICHFFKVLARRAGLLTTVAAAAFFLGAPAGEASARAAEPAYPATEVGGESQYSHFPIPLNQYKPAPPDASLSQVLTERNKQSGGFNLAVTLVFLGAIIHTFLAGRFERYSHKLALRYKEKLKETNFRVMHPEERLPVSFASAIFHFLGEVEAVFGIWIIPFMFVCWKYYSFEDFSGLLELRLLLHGAHVRDDYHDHRLFPPHLQAGGIRSQLRRQTWKIFARGLVDFRDDPCPPARLPDYGTCRHDDRRPDPEQEVLRPQAEEDPDVCNAGAAFCEYFHRGHPDAFCRPPVVMVAEKWDWGLAHMIQHFGWKAVSAIIISNLAYFFLFRKEFARLAAQQREFNEFDDAVPQSWEDRNDKIPAWVTLAHVCFLTWTVLFAHEPVMFIGSFLFFIGFTVATPQYQNQMSLRVPMMVGFFLAGLVILGGVQAWWLEPVLTRLGDYAMIGATLLTAFNDNAAVTFLASTVPNLPEAVKYSVVAGAVTGGGLTVIANAPNPAGQAILGKYFKGINPLWLFAWAAFPTAIVFIFFTCFGH